MNYFDDLGRFGDAQALIMEDGNALTFLELESAADSVGKYLVPRSLVFLLADNRPEAVAGYLACLRARAPAALFASTLHTSFLAELLRVYRPLYVWLPRERAAEVPNAVPIYAFGGYALLATGSTQIEVDEALALLVTTSGSTGSPKLVRLSYSNLAANAESISAYLKVEAADRAITSLPMNYVYGLSVINSQLLRGASILLTNASLTEKRFWELVKNCRASSLSGVPYTYEMLKRLRFHGMDLPSLKTLTQAGGKLHADLVREFAEISQEKEIRFYVMYGAAEATARMSYLPPENALTKPGSIGCAIPGGQFWLQDKDGKVIEEPGVTGELYYRGPNVSLGYASCQEDLARADERGGVLATGDLAERDRCNMYSIVGRRSRFLKLFGNRVNLEEIEQMVRTTGIDCACHGNDSKLRIYITEQDRRDAVLSAVEEMTRIHRSALSVVVLDRIPRAPSGKIMYTELS
jgi:acyl-CoA synthetase (AMP-forming)/AMP-acid ligase II